MKQSIFSFKEFCWGKGRDLMTHPTRLGNKKTKSPNTRKLRNMKTKLHPRSSQGHIWACSQTPALLKHRFSHLVALFHKSLPSPALHHPPQWAQTLSTANGIRELIHHKTGTRKNYAFSAARHGERLSQEALLAKWVFPLLRKVRSPSKAETFCRVFPAECWLQTQLEAARQLHAACSFPW